MNRFGVIAGAFAILVAGCGEKSAAPAPAATSAGDRLVAAPDNAARPNVVILLADDLGWADVGYRGSDIKTPHIDSLATEGMRLERFYATPICTPTRAALMTGRDPLKLGVAHAVLMPWDNGGVSPEEHFMPESFRAAGYETAMIGKWHLGHTIEQHTPNARGFDHFFGHFHTQVSYFDHGFAGGHDMQENGVSVRREGEYATDIHGDEAVRYLTELRDDEKPFFLYVPFLAPHSPMEAPDDVKAKYPKRLDVPGSPRKTYAAMVDSMDQAVGRILTALEEEDVAENTIVLFFSDNGGFINYGASNKPLRGEKLTPFEGGVRVNAVMRWPAVIAPGTVSNETISVMDLLPTLAAVAGVDAGHEKKIDGENRWSAIAGEGPAARSAPLYFTSNVPIYNKFQFGVIDGDWKLVQMVDHQALSTEVETMLFDLSIDPNEENDLSADNRAVVDRLQGLLLEWRARHPAGGTYVSINPHPGWRAPKDYVDGVLPAELVNEEAHKGFGVLESRVLQQRYGERGRIVYE